MGKIKVLLFVNSFRIGGSERQAVELAKQLDRTRFDPLVVCFRKDGPLGDELPGGIDRVPTFPLNGFFNAGAFRQALRFIGLVRCERVDVVQCFNFYSNLFAIPLARLAGVPIIIGSRRDEAVMMTSAQQRAERWCFRMATGVVANAEAIRGQLTRRDGLAEEKVWVIHNGLNLERFDGGAASRVENVGDHQGGVTVAVIANLRPEKGHLVFLDAVERLIPMCPETRFLIVGDGPMRDAITAQIQGRILGDRVRLTGSMKDIPGFLPSVDVVVLPSLKNEGLPNAVMEAMAASKPVVATATGGTGELVKHGVTGYLVKPGDVSALVEPLGILCRDGELRRKMGEAGRRRIVEEFAADRMGRRFENLYIELVQSCKRAR